MKFYAINEKKFKEKFIKLSLIISFTIIFSLVYKVNSLTKKVNFDFNDYGKNKFSASSLNNKKYNSNRIKAKKSKFNFGVDLHSFNKFYEQKEAENFLQENIKENEESSIKPTNDKTSNPPKENFTNNTNENLNFLDTSFSIKRVKAQNGKSPIKKLSQIKDIKFTSIFKTINSTFIKPNVLAFRTDYTNRHVIDYKMLDRELEDLFYLMIFRDQKKLTPQGVQQFFKIFMSGYVQCDKDKDNVLNKQEFISCMKNDDYLKLIKPPEPEKANYKKAGKNPKEFYTAFFELLDDRHMEYINFINYAKVRLFLFSWRKCSINSPYIEEKDFECAIDLISDFKFKSRTITRQIYFEALYLSNNPSNRNIDFLTFSVVANSLRLFTAINVKNDEDITRSEFNMALDVNILPLRYNQLIIDQFFELMRETDRPNDGIDLQSFIFYDFALQLFSMKNVGRRYYLDKKEFPKVFENPLFPNKTLKEIEMIPQFNITKDSYQMYQYYNMSVIEEQDFFEKYKFFFMELNSESKLKEQIKNNVENNFASNLKEEFNTENKEKSKFKGKMLNLNKLENSLKNANSKFSLNSRTNKFQSNSKSQLKSQTNIQSQSQKMSSTLGTKANTKAQSSSKSLSSTKTNLKSRFLSKKFNSLKSQSLKNQNKQDYFLKDNAIEIFNNKFQNGPNEYKNDFNIKIKFDLKNTSNKIFDVLDADNDGFINFKEFAEFYQMAYTFSKVDKYSRGKLTAGAIYDLYSTYSDYPAISFIFRDRVNRFNNFEANIYFDLLSALALFKIDDLVSYYSRKLDKMTLNEIDLKLLLNKINMKYLPENIIKGCMRGFDYNSIPRFDWECTINDGMTLNLNYFESLMNYKRVKENDVSLDMTDFYNVDKNYE